MPNDVIDAHIEQERRQATRVRDALHRIRGGVLAGRAPVETVDAETAPAGKLAWPKNMREQVAAVRAALARRSLPLEAIAAQFKRSPKAAALAVIEALEELGMARRDGEAYRLQA